MERGQFTKVSTNVLLKKKKLILYHSQKFGPRSGKNGGYLGYTYMGVSKFWSGNFV